MPIRWDKRNKCWRFEFNRVIAGRRRRASKLLPAGWSQAQADAFDRQESARLYAVGTGVQREDPLIDTAIALYLGDKTGLKSYKATSEHLASIAWAYTGKRLTDLATVATAVTSTELERGIAPATVRNRLACLKAACRHAWKKHGITDADPTTRMQLPAVRNERHVYLERAGMLKLARAAKHHDTRVAFRVAFYSGLRMSELYKVRVDGNRLILADTKNGDMRAVPVHPRIGCCLPHLPITINRSTLQKDIARAKACAQISGVRFHDLRHSAASEMVNAGVDLFTVGTVLGHRDPRSTKRYSHLTAARLADAVGMIGRKNPHKSATTPRKKAAG